MWFLSSNPYSIVVKVAYRAAPESGQTVLTRSHTMYQLSTASESEGGIVVGEDGSSAPVALRSNSRLRKKYEERGRKMSWRAIKLATLAILGLVLAAVPGLVGCGGGGGGENTVLTIGSLADFSGPASFAVVPTVNAFEEALLYYQEQDPI